MHPVVVPILALVAVGGALAWKYQDKLKPHDKMPDTPGTPQGNHTEPVTVNKEAEAKKASAAGLGPLPAGFGSYSEWIQKQSSAIPQAHLLYDYLKAHGVDNLPKMQELTQAFQKAHNANKISEGIGGHLDEDGEYDAATSSALTLYTGDPIPGNVNAAPPLEATLGQILTGKVIGQDGTNLGSAQASGFNVRQYLDRWGTENWTPELAVLVAQFQNDMNTDPLFPGPAYKLSPKPANMFKEVMIDGQLGDKGSDTRRALKMQTSPTDALYNWY